jgi:hypothetical protein
LIGQVTALALNVGFDYFDPNFNPSSVPLGDMVIMSGPFTGKTVSQFLAIANDVLGGCSYAYSPSQVNETASRINEGCENRDGKDHDDDDDRDWDKDKDRDHHKSSYGSSDHRGGDKDKDERDRDGKCKFLMCPGGTPER